MQGVIKLDKHKMFPIMEWGAKKVIVVPVIIEVLWYGTKRKWKKMNCDLQIKLNFLKKCLPSRNSEDSSENIGYSLSLKRNVWIIF